MSSLRVGCISEGHCRQCFEFVGGAGEVRFIVQGRHCDSFRIAAMQQREHGFFGAVHAWLSLGILQAEHRVLQRDWADRGGEGPLRQGGLAVHIERHADRCAEGAAVEKGALEGVGDADAVCDEQHQGHHDKKQQECFQQCQGLVGVNRQLVFERESGDGCVGVEQFQALPLLGGVVLIE